MSLDVSVITHRLHSSHFVTDYRDIHIPDVRLSMPYIILIITEYAIVYDIYIMLKKNTKYEPSINTKLQIHYNKK